jgi:hypothetical protein
MIPRTYLLHLVQTGVDTELSYHHYNFGRVSPSYSPYQTHMTCDIEGNITSTGNEGP